MRHVRKFRVRHDFSRYRPAQWRDTDYARLFGPQNEGFVIEAIDLGEARSIVRERYRRNPFYVAITEEPRS